MKNKNSVLYLMKFPFKMTGFTFTLIFFLVYLAKELENNEC